MKGLELARQYYEAFGKPMLQKEFPEALPYLAIGLAGSGSECYGYDDRLSRDHDFEPGFCIFLPEESIVDRRTAFLLERAYAKLPKEFLGWKRSPLSPVGGNRHGVIRMEEFFGEKVGSPNGALTVDGWFSVPEFGLLEATNGAIFEDRYGKFTEIRGKLSKFPEDVRRKKLAGVLLLMGQAGQYNYPRCVARGETGAAQLAAFEFVQNTLHGIHLINGAYMPYYKWSFRGIRELPRLSHLEGELETLISVGNSAEEAEKKIGQIERIAKAFAAELSSLVAHATSTSELEALAYAVNDTVSDGGIRNLHVLYGV